MSITSRMTLGASLVGIAALLIVLAFRYEDSDKTADFLLNAGTELGGIAITVLAIDWLMAIGERRRNAVAIAQPSARDLHRVVWVWLGAGKDFDLARDMAALQRVNDDNHAIAAKIRKMLLELGSKADHTRRVQTEVMRTHPKLRIALEQIAQLYLADEALTPKEVAAILAAAIHGYADTLGLSTSPVESVPVVDASLAAQLDRYDQLRG